MRCHGESSYAKFVYVTSAGLSLQVHSWPKLTSRLIHECVTRCVTRCQVTRGTVENLNTLQEIVWETKYGRFTTINISKYEYFTRKINKIYSCPVCPS